MAYEQKPNQGAIFKNKRKEKESHPDLTGTIIIEAAGEYWVSGWKKADKNGDTFVSLSLKPKDADKVEVRKVAAKAQAPLGYDDDLPPF
jgi:hypothetical protein